MSNVFSFTGTVGKDAEVRYAATGMAVMNVTVANNVGFGDKQQTLWVNVTLFGKRAEGQLATFLKKGQQVFISGELTQREYKANDGTMRTSLDLVANIIDLVGKRNESSPSPAPQPYPVQATQQPSAPAPVAASHDNFNTPYDDDIPF
jgi:single-strand DNA-binding protein